MTLRLIYTFSLTVMLCNLAIHASDTDNLQAPSSIISTESDREYSPTNVLSEGNFAADYDDEKISSQHSFSLEDDLDEFD